MLGLFKRKKKPTKSAKDELQNVNKKPKKKKLTRAEKKKIKERRKRAKKRNAIFRGEPGFMAEGYIDFDSYVRINQDGEYLSLFDVRFAPGTFNPASVGWQNMLIPTVPLRKGQIQFMKREKNMGKGEEDAILSSRLTSRLVTNVNEKISDDSRENSRKEVEQRDLQLASELSKNDNLTDSDMTLIIKASSPERIEDTLDELRQNYKDRGLVGISFVRKTAIQRQELLDLPHKVSEDVFHASNVQTVIAGDLFLPSSGFADRYGTVVGSDIHSYLAGTPSIIDFHGVRHAVIMTGGIQGLISIGGGEGAQLVSNPGSGWAHLIADDNYLVDGTRTYHIYLTDFVGGYHAYDSRVFDMSKYTINTLETYGTKETVAQDANNNFDKVTEIIMLLMSNQNPSPSLRQTLQQRLVTWVTERAGVNGIYTRDPAREPNLAYRILATKNHETYPTLQDFIPDLQGLVAGASKVGERARQEAEILLNAVTTASMRYPSVFNEKTNIPDSFGYEDRNIYFDLSKVGGGTINAKMLKGAVFLNTISYVANRAKPGDMVVVHGIDSVLVSPSVLGPYRDILDRKHIGLVTTFEGRGNQDMNIETLKDFVHSLVEQDVFIVGGLQPENQELIARNLGHPLPENVITDLSAQQPSIFYLYRSSDFGSAVIDTHLRL